MVQVGEKRNLMKYFYPAIFTLDRKKNEFRAVFPDLTGCAVKAESMAEAARKAREALGMALMELEEKGIEFPAASDECALQRAYPYCQVGVVLLDMDVYRAYREYRMEQAELDSAEWAENLNAAALHCFREFWRQIGRQKRPVRVSFFVSAAIFLQQGRNEAINLPCILF